MAEQFVEFAEVLDSTEVDNNVVNSVKRKKLNMQDINGMKVTGDGSEFLGDDGAYHAIQGGVDGDYYRLDGSVPIEASFAGGDQQFKDAQDATDGKDLTTLVQVEAKLEIGAYNTQTRIADAKKGL